MFFSFIHRAICVCVLFFLSACGGGAGDSGSSGASASTPQNSMTSLGQTSNPTSTTDRLNSTSSTSETTESGSIPQSPISNPAIDPALTANVAPSEPLPTNNCKGDANVQCSGASTLQIDNHIAATASGVHTYGVSTSDLTETVNPNNPVGLKLASGGTVEVRSSRSKNSTPSDVTLILSNIGLSWDGKTERPPIIETFSQTSKRVELSSNGALLNKALPQPNDESFYDFAILRSAATQSHYANNVYFPRPLDSACSNGNANTCLLTESPPLVIEFGDWKTGGNRADKLITSHAHLDGAVEVGSGVGPSKITNSNNSISIENSMVLGGLTPGAQGFRQYTQWSYGWSNLGVWNTQDKVNMQFWGGSQDFQKRISGTVAFGTVSIPERIPQSGTATYSGNVYGWLSYDYEGSTIPFFADANVTVNFAKNTAEFVFSKTRTVENDYSYIYLPSVHTTLTLDRQKLKNYLNGRMNFENYQGGIGARFFGPITTGGSGSAPVEMAGTFNMQCEPVSECMVLVGGFLLKKQ
jgi:hypothetical protein